MAHPVPAHPAPRRRRRRPVAASLALIVLGAALVAPSVGVQAATTSAYASAVVADAPAAWWRLGESRRTRAADAAGSSHGTYRNGVRLGRASLLAGDATSSAAWFDGVDDDVRIPSSAGLSPTAAVSVEAWIRPDVLPAAGAFASIVAKREAYALQFNGPRLEFTIIQSGTRRRLQAAAGAIVAGRTYHVLGTYGSGRQRLYIDGVEVASVALTGSITATPDDLTIGSWGGTKERFGGALDEVAIYARVLGPDRVAAHAQAGRGSKPGTPSPTATPAPTPRPTPSPSATPGATQTPSPSPTPGATPSPSPAPTATPSSTPPPADASLGIGMAAHFMWQTLADTDADLDRMQAAGMTYARFDVSWRNSEPARGSYLYLDKLDQVVAAVRDHGMAMTITVIETPGWANANRGMFAPPADMADYARFVGMLAERYADVDGIVWEIWNEQNDPHFWTTGPDAAEYAAMLSAAYAAVKAADPDAPVITGGILFNDTGFLERIYAAGAGTSFDGLGIHPYTIDRAPRDTSSAYYGFANSVPQFQAVLDRHGHGSKPIWITEFGWSTAKVSDATRAAWFTESVAVARAWSNVRGLAAYTIRQTQFAEYGLVTPTGTATLSWNAYAAAAR